MGKTQNVKQLMKPPKKKKSPAAIFSSCLWKLPESALKHHKRTRNLSVRLRQRQEFFRRLLEDRVPCQDERPQGT